MATTTVNHTSREGYWSNVVIDTRIKSAIERAVAESGQPATLATKIVAWFEGLSSGNESLEDRESLQRRIVLLYEGVRLDDDDNEDDDGDDDGGSQP